jgi:hypothetical protein
MSFTQPQGSKAPATLDITYSRSEGAPALALLGSEPHLQPVTPVPAMAAAWTAGESAPLVGETRWRSRGRTLDEEARLFTDDI